MSVLTALRRCVVCFVMSSESHCFQSDHTTNDESDSPNGVTYSSHRTVGFRKHNLYDVFLRAWCLLWPAFAANKVPHLSSSPDQTSSRANPRHRPDTPQALAGHVWNHHQAGKVSSNAPLRFILVSAILNCCFV